jgi:hypothetical protein
LGEGMRMAGWPVDEEELMATGVSL